MYRQGRNVLALSQRFATQQLNCAVTLRWFAKYPDHVVLEMPALSPTMERGNLAKWFKAVGDKIDQGEAMADVETDKATVAFQAVDEGYLAKILVPAGTADIAVGTPVAVLAETAASVAAFADYVPDGAKQAATAPAPTATPTPTANPTPTATPTPTPTPATSTAPASATPVAATGAGGRIIASPAARAAAAQASVSLQAIAGTGPNRRILKADVLNAPAPAPAPAAAAAPKVASASTTPPATGEFLDIPHTNVRRTIAKRLSESKQNIPHYYLSVDVQMNAVLKLRAELNNAQAEGAPKLSVNDFVIKATALACKRVPQANAAWMENAIRQYNYVDVSVAVSTDAGLITPIVADADLKGLNAISNDVKRLAASARDGKLQPHEFIGGTVTVSNLGMFGVKSFSAIINPPQAIILAVGASEERVIPASKAQQEAGPQFTTGTFMSVTLSCDHRVVDGAVGAQWLAAFKGFLEKPTTMLL